MSLNVGETKVISTCKKNRNSKWANGQDRRTTKGMNMVVSIEKDIKGNKISRTYYK